MYVCMYTEREINLNTVFFMNERRNLRRKCMTDFHIVDSVRNKKVIQEY